MIREHTTHSELCECFEEKERLTGSRDCHLPSTRFNKQVKIPSGEMSPNAAIGREAATNSRKNGKLSSKIKARKLRKPRKLREGYNPMWEWMKASID